MFKLSLIALLLSITMACQKKPNISGSLDTMSELLYPPMGDETFNGEIKKELQLLDDIFDEKIDNNSILKLKNKLMVGEKLISPEEKVLGAIFLTLPELIYEIKHDKANKSWFKAKYLFLKRRFAESLILLSGIEQNSPFFFKAKSFRARAIFFLGNPDRSITELLAVAQNNKASLDEKLDAYYLAGAIAHESDEIDEKLNHKAIEAWEKYLSLSDEKSQLHHEVKLSLAKLKERNLSKNQTENQDIFLPNKKYSQEKNNILLAFKEEKYQLALDQINKLTVQDDKELFIVKARVFLKTFRTNEAFSLFEEAVKKYPTYAPAWHFRGMSFMLKGDTQKAIDCWKQVFKLDKNYGLKNKLDERISIAEKMLEPGKVLMH